MQLWNEFCFRFWSQLTRRNHRLRATRVVDQSPRYVVARLVDQKMQAKCNTSFVANILLLLWLNTVFFLCYILRMIYMPNLYIWVKWLISASACNSFDLLTGCFLLAADKFCHVKSCAAHCWKGVLYIYVLFPALYYTVFCLSMYHIAESIFWSCIIKTFYSFFVKFCLIFLQCDLWWVVWMAKVHRHAYTCIRKRWLFHLLY